MATLNKHSFFKDLSHPWVRSQNFVECTAADWLARSEVALAKGHFKRPPAWVLDLDSTLFCVSDRLKKVFGHFLAQQEAPPLWWWRLWASLQPEEHRYGVRTTFREILKKVDAGTARERAAQLWEIFESHWNVGFFSDRFIAHDAPYPGAVEFVQRLYDLGFHIVYLTGRDRPRTAAGTYAALKTHRFPMGERARLFIKPDQHTPDLDYKHQVSEELHAQYDVFALMDNEPENLSMFAKKFPRAEVIFFHSIMSPRTPREIYRTALGDRSAWRMNSFES